MIEKIWIDNFKSLVDFTLKLSKFTCLVGLNSSGKSTVLQAIDFLSQLMQGDLNNWLKERLWDSADINSKLTSKSNVDFEVIVSSKNYGMIIWSGSFNRTTLKCTKERVQIDKTLYLQVENGSYSIAKFSSSSLNPLEREVMVLLPPSPVMFKYQGSILSQLKEKQFNPVLHILKQSIAEIRSLDLLSPELLRGQSKSAEGMLGLGGGKLSAFIHESGEDIKTKLKGHLVKAYNQLDSIDTKSLRYGWKQLEIIEKYGDKTLKTTARHMNDGMLRFIAVFAQLEAENSFLLFDEIENGVNPELTEYLVDHLVHSTHQILVTSHSPMILNFLEDDIAKSGVVYLYKTDKGFTKATQFFYIPSIAKKMNFMGPGEVFIDTDLTELYREITAL